MTREAFSARCHAIEEAYEFMLAYAAQGVRGHASDPAGEQIREFLTRADRALSGLGDLYASVIDGEGTELAGAHRAFLVVLDRDARAAQAALELVLGQPAISSQLVDNLNASIHLRALLTDLFLIDEALNGSPGSAR